MQRLLLLLLAGLIAGAFRGALADEPTQAVGAISLAKGLTHLRNDAPREWSSFPEEAQASQLKLIFPATANDGEFALHIRQQDVKQPWRIVLNEKPLGELIRDELDIAWYLSIPAGALKAGENTLRIEAKGPKQPADDIRVGELWFEPRSVREALSGGVLEIDVADEATKIPLPSRLTIVNEDGALQASSSVSTETLAVRPGVIYTSDGKARFHVPPGKYTIYAGRGFEYSLAKATVDVQQDRTAPVSLLIRREVATPGLVACDTHSHTLTFSGHGDATIDERMITLAGEGIELPIATDHNVHIDYRPHAKRMGVEKYFTPVMGNEVTTSVGHFNVFPVNDGARLPNHRLKEWGPIFDEIFTTPGVRVAILNHARDLHSGVRPFGPERFNATVGESFLEWPMRFNAMEIVNSGAIQTDPLQLVHDWLALLNRGYQVTPVGSSDSHDVARHFVGQGRTYIRCDDRDAGQLDVDQAVTNFLQGRVTVSYGLLVDMKVNDKFAAGDLAEANGDELAIQLRVLGPHWTTAERIQLYQNGQLIREEKIVPPADRSQTPGQQWQGVWKIPRPKHDVHLVALAIGKGIDDPYWPTAKPYQPTSPDWKPMTLSLSGATWVDGDSDGQRSSARAYAERLVGESKGDFQALIKSLAAYDRAVAVQATHLHLTKGNRLPAEQIDTALEPAGVETADGVRAAWRDWLAQEMARAEQ